MPLAKGKLLSKPMRNMHIVLQRMAIWTQYLQIAQFIVFSVSIFVMNTKYFFNLVVPTSLTRDNKPSFYHVFSYTLKCWRPFFFFRLVNALNATKYSWLGWAGKKSYSAVQTVDCHRSLGALSFVVTISATVLRSVGSRRYMGKFFATNIAICNDLNASRKGLAGSRAVPKGFESVLRYIDKLLAVTAGQHFSSVRL